MQYSVWVHAAKLVILLCALVEAPVGLLCGAKQHPIPAGCLHMALQMPPTCEAHAALAPTTLRAGRKRDHLGDTGCCWSVPCTLPLHQEGSVVCCLGLGLSMQLLLLSSHAVSDVK